MSCDKEFVFPLEILSIIKDDIKNAKVLDIGVGGGRTTLYFSKKAKMYLEKTTVLQNNFAFAFHSLNIIFQRN